MSSKAQYFATVVLDSFESVNLTTDEQIKAAGGPSNTWMTGLRKAAQGEPMSEPRSDVYRRIEKAANWAPNSAREVWRGGRPTVLDPRVSLREALGLPPAPDTERRVVQFSTGLEGFVERVWDRLLDLEERIDVLEARGSYAAPTPVNPIEQVDVGPSVKEERAEGVWNDRYDRDIWDRAADEPEQSIAAEQEADPHP